MTVATGKQKYADKANIAVQKYNAAKGVMEAHWTAGLAAAGVNPGPLTRQAYAQGIARAQYHMGDADKWERNYRDGMSR